MSAGSPDAGRAGEGSRGLIHAHTGLRGLAAACVVCVHLPLPARQLQSLFPRGYLLVDLFFLLSGFVMAYTYRGRFARAGAAWPQARAFWEARIARIYPLHAFVLLAMAAAAIAMALAHARFGLLRPIAWPLDLYWARELLLLNNWTSAPDLAWNFPSWSIAAEAHVYLVFPLLIVALVRAPAASTIGFALLAAGLYAFLAGTPLQLDQIGWLALPRALAGFLLGMLIEGLRPALARVPAPMLTLAQVAAVLAAAALLVRPWPTVLVIVPFAVLVAATADDRGAAARLLGSRLGRWLGDRSYSVYLVHIGVVEGVGQLLGRAGVPMGEAGGRLAMDVAGALLVLAVAHVTFVRVEQPARTWMRDRFHLTRVGIRRSPPAP